MGRKYLGGRSWVWSTRDLIDNRYVPVYSRSTYNGRFFARVQTCYLILFYLARREIFEKREIWQSSELYIFHLQGGIKKIHDKYLSPYKAFWLVISW